MISLQGIVFPSITKIIFLSNFNFVFLKDRNFSLDGPNDQQSVVAAVFYEREVSLVEPPHHVNGALLIAVFENVFFLKGGLEQTV